MQPLPSSITLDGTFVRLRPLRPDDAELTWSWRHSQRARFLNRGAPTVAAQREWIRTLPQSEFNFIIERTDGRAVGMVALLGIDLTNSHAETGRFLIGEPEAVRGIPAAVEAMMLIYDFAFNALQLVRVWGTIAGENRLMLKWQLFLGMREEGRLRCHYNLEGRLQDAVVLGMLAEEYRNCALPRMQSLVQAAGPAASAPAVPPKEQLNS
jgi:diamine N-acetyltransferase